MKLHGSHRRNGEVTLYNLAEMLKRLSEQLDAWTATLPKTYEHGDDKGD